MDGGIGIKPFRQGVCGFNKQKLAILIHKTAEFQGRRLSATGHPMLQPKATIPHRQFRKHGRKVHEKICDEPFVVYAIAEPRRPL